jgi:hypothetical protein
MRLLNELVLLDNDGVTDKAVIALARAIDERGLPNLEGVFMGGLYEDKVTGLGFGAISHALLRGCPRLEEIRLQCHNDGKFAEAIIEGMYKGAGRTVLIFTD